MSLSIKTDLFILSLGGCDNYLKQVLQRIQNQATRIVARHVKSISISELLRLVGRLSLEQLAVYHTWIMVFNVLKSRKPEFLYKKFDQEFYYKTRFAKENNIKIGPQLRADLEIAKTSYCPRAARDFNKLPLKVKSQEKVEKFKYECKLWIKKNIPVGGIWGLKFPFDVFKSGVGAIFHWNKSM